MLINGPSVCWPLLSSFPNNVVTSYWHRAMKCFLICRMCCCWSSNYSPSICPLAHTPPPSPIFPFLFMLLWECHGVIDFWLSNCVAAGQGRSLLSPTSALCLCQSCQCWLLGTKKKKREAEIEGGENDRAGWWWGGHSERWAPDEGNE